jgi:hypothetical protein
VRALATMTGLAGRPVADRITPAQSAIVSFSRHEIDVHALRDTLRAAGWSHDQVETLVASARRNLRRAGA